MDWQAGAGLSLRKREHSVMPANLLDPAVRRHLYISIAKKRAGPGSGSGPETLWARTWRRPVFDLRTLTSVPFVVGGGVATRLYAPERMIDDLDILIEAQKAALLSADLTGRGCQKLGSLPIGGSHWRLPDGTALDSVEESAPWAAEAIAHPALGPDGLPVIALPYLVLMKMRAGRAIDIGDLSRILGAADESSLALTRSVMAANLPDGLEDLESLIQLGRLEYGASTPL